MPAKQQLTASKWRHTDSDVRETVQGSQGSGAVALRRPHWHKVHASAAHLALKAAQAPGAMPGLEEAGEAEKQEQGLRSWLRCCTQG